LFFRQLDQFANTTLDFDRRMQLRCRQFPLPLSQRPAITLPSGEPNALDLERGGPWPPLRISPKPLRRRLSAASVSFRMPGQDCAVRDLTKTFDLPRQWIDN